MQSIFRRAYATLPDAAAAARTASTPRAVRLRRLRRRPASAGPPPESDALPSGLTPTEFARYQRALAKGELLGAGGREPTEAEWLDKLNARRTRLRGTRRVTATDGTKETQVVGQKVYLPNILFRLVRNHTPAGKPYNPYEATFRIPQSVTKTDVRAYLAAVYGVQTTYIRTDNYIAPIGRKFDASYTSGPSHRTYKRAVVGLVEPFYYPDAVEDMSAAERIERQKFLEETYMVSRTKEMIKEFLLRSTKKNSKSWQWRGPGTLQRGKILKRIAEQKALREEFVQTTKEQIQGARRRELQVA